MGKASAFKQEQGVTEGLMGKEASQAEGLSEVACERLTSKKDLNWV